MLQTDDQGVFAGKRLVHGLKVAHKIETRPPVPLRRIRHVLNAIRGRDPRPLGAVTEVRLAVPVVVNAVHLRIEEFNPVAVSSDGGRVDHLVGNAPGAFARDRCCLHEILRRDIPGGLRIGRHDGDVGRMGDDTGLRDRDGEVIFCREDSQRLISPVVCHERVKIPLAIVNIVVHITVLQPVVAPEVVSVSIDILQQLAGGLEDPRDPIHKIELRQRRVSLGIPRAVRDHKDVGEGWIGRFVDLVPFERLRLQHRVHGQLGGTIPIKRHLVIACHRSQGGPIRRLRELVIGIVDLLDRLLILQQVGNIGIHTAPPAPAIHQGKRKTFRRFRKEWKVSRTVHKISVFPRNRSVIDN